MIRTERLAVGETIVKQVEVRIEEVFDVVVAGGGVAGLAAAVAAGRQGASVLLVERKNFVGGNAAMGLQVLGTHTITGKRATAGLPGEFLRRLKEQGAATDAILDARVCSFVAVEPAWVKVLAGQMLQEAGVKVLLHSGITDVVATGGPSGTDVRGVVINGTRGVKSRVVVDTSGDGTVAAMAGAPFERGQNDDGMLQPATLIFRMGNVDVPRGRAALLERGDQIVHEEFLKSIGIAKEEYAPWAAEFFNANAFRREVQEAIRVGDLPADFPQQRVIWSNLLVPGEAMVLMAKVLGVDASRSAELSEAEGRALEMVPRLVRFMQRYVPGFEHAHLIDVAPQIGVRETRRIVGEHVLDEEDILEGRHFPDSIGLGAYYLDVHPPKGGDKTLESMRYPLEPYEMPYRMLLPLQVDGLLIAGRCSSAMSKAFGAVRVIPSCMVQGEAAGTAAALCASMRVAPRSLASTPLQETLLAGGVFLRAEEADSDLQF